MTPWPDDHTDIIQMSAAEPAGKCDMDEPSKLPSAGNVTESAIVVAESRVVSASIFCPPMMKGSVSVPEMPVFESVEGIKQHRENCIKAGRYEEAEEAQTRMHQLRELQSSRQQETLQAQHLAERISVEEIHLRELNEFNGFWDKKTVELEQRSQAMKTSLEEKHEQERAQYVEKLRRDLSSKQPHFSCETLKARKLEEALVKVKKFAEAGKAKLQADQMEAKEIEEFESKRELKLAALEEKFVQKQRLEMTGLAKRLETWKAEQILARKAEFRQLVQRGHNMKKQLENQHKILQKRSAMRTRPVAEPAAMQTMTMSRAMASPRSMVSSRCRGASPSCRGASPRGSPRFQFRSTSTVALGTAPQN